MPRSFHVPNAAPLSYYPSHNSVHEHDRPLYPIYPHYYPHPHERENTEFTYLEAHNDNGNDDGTDHIGGATVANDFEAKPAARAHAAIHEPYHDNEPPKPPSNGQQLNGHDHHTYDMRHPPPPHLPPHPLPPYYTPYYTPYHPPPYHYPHRYPHPPLDPSARKLRKNAQSRDRAQSLRAKIHHLHHLPHKTPQQLQLLRKYEERRLKKNGRTRQRAAETKARMEEIASKPEGERSEEEKEILRVGMERRRRKNEGDRLRRMRLKEGGRERGGGNGGWWGVSGAGSGMVAGSELEGGQWSELERQDLDNLMTEEVSELLLQDDDDDEEEDVEKAVDR